QFLRWGRGRVLEVRMGRPDRTRDSIDLVPASVNARPRVVEHAVLGEDVVDGRSSANGVALAEYVVQVARQQGGYAGHGLSELSASLSGVHSAIHGKVRAGDVRRLRTGDERHQRSDLINVPVAVECCGGLQRYRPIARGGTQIRVDRARLHVVDRDAPAPDL